MLAQTAMLDSASIPLAFYTVAQRRLCGPFAHEGLALKSMRLMVTWVEAMQFKKQSRRRTRTWSCLYCNFASMPTSSNELQLDFTVFAPATAKVLLTGRSLYKR